MKIPIHIAENLVLLSQGKSIAAGSVKHAVIEELVAEKIIERTGRIHKKLSIPNTKAFSIYLQNKYSINNLEQYVATLQRKNVSRGEATQVSGNSKLKNIRTFKGFLINCYFPVQAAINGKPVTIRPIEGTFQFICDFENFTIAENIIIVGVENPENFRYIEKQKYLFENMNPLFVSRYPQNQSKDLIKWLQSIPNQYLHFGDFDFAGIGIYLNEYKKHLGNRASFLVPEDIENLLEHYGNKNLYDNQKIKLHLHSIREDNLTKLIRIIHQYKKGLEQEILIINKR
jgi:hypothetical protein